MQKFKISMEHNVDNMNNQTQNSINNWNSNNWKDRLVLDSFLPDSLDNVNNSFKIFCQDSFKLPQYLNDSQYVTLGDQKHYQCQLENVNNNLANISLNISKPRPRHKPTACENLAVFVNSIKPILPSSNDLICSSQTEIQRNKTVKQKCDEQLFVQVSDRSHLHTSSCKQIKIPSSQQPNTFTSSEKIYTTVNKTKEYHTVNIKNLVTEGEKIIDKNYNKQLYQANAFSINKISECHNLHSQQKQFFDKPSAIKPIKTTLHKTYDLVKENKLSKYIVENNLENYKRPITIPLKNEQDQQQQQLQESVIKKNSRYPYTQIKTKLEEFLTDIQEINIQFDPVCPSINFKSPFPYSGNNIKEKSIPLKHVTVPNCSRINISPTSNIVIEMKYESGPPTTPSHLTSSGVEPPHSSQTSGIVMGDSPAEVVGVDSLLLSPWAANAPEFLEGGVPDKQTAGFQDTSWVDSLMLGSTVNVASAQSLMEIKGPLPAFTNYTGHLSINGISGHHYHTIASSGQRSSVPSASPTPSSNQEYYESPVVSSSTPCPQVSQKHQPQNHQQQQQQQQHPHPQNQHQQQQQLPQSTQQMEYDIEDIAEIIGSAIADTTVPGNGNGPSSEQTSDTSRDWIDIAEWMIPECSPKTQESTSPNSFASQIYVTTTPAMPTQQHAGSALQNLLTQNYSPLLQARLQAGNVGLQNASCGETPSSTSPYPPLSPPNRVSTSCSPDDLLHSSFATPSHPRKRSRSSPGSGQNSSKKNPTVNTAVLPYGAESEVIGNPKKPVHRCHICSRAFLNKSNIKVHLRTHTGEKPFKCDVCSKAFRQKAHLIKHQQIHRRGGRE